MKKLILTSIIALLGISLFAQEAESKKVQAGIILGSGVNFQAMNTKNVQKNGVGANMSIGAVVNIGFTNNIGFATGLELDVDYTKFKKGDSNLYYHYKDNKILRSGDDHGAGNAEGIFSLSERSQQGMFLTLPTMVIFRTNYIGYFRYYGKLGLRNSFLLTSKANDKGSMIEFGQTEIAEGENRNMKLNKGNDMLFYKGSAGVVFGAEWNFVGPTCLAFEVGYYYGFTPLFYNSKEPKRTLFKNLLAPEYINNAAHQSQLLFKVAVLF